MGKTMQGHIEDMAVALEPGGEPAQLVMVFQQQDFVAAIGKAIGGRQPPQSRADDNRIIGIRRLRNGTGIEIIRIIEVECRNGSEFVEDVLIYHGTPLSIEPTMPRNP